MAVLALPPSEFRGILRVTAARSASLLTLEDLPPYPVRPAVAEALVPALVPAPNNLPVMIEAIARLPVGFYCSKPPISTAFSFYFALFSPNTAQKGKNIGGFLLF